MSLGTISITEGSGDKLLATSTIVQGGQTVSLQRVIVENFGNAAPDTYASAVFPTSATSAGVLLSIENTGANTNRALYVARIEIEQIGVATTGASVRFDFGRTDENGTGGDERIPLAVDPDVTDTSIRLRISSNATPNTGIAALAATAGDPIYASRMIRLGSTAATLARAVFDFSGMGQYPSVPTDSTEPLALEIDGTMDGADVAINVVILEHEL
jgi:hypothetical protein